MPIGATSKRSPEASIRLLMQIRKELKKRMSDLKNISNSFHANITIDLDGNGWNDILNELHRKLLVLDENYKIIKLINNDGILDIKILCKKHPQAVYKAIKRYITNAVAESQLTCIECGDSKFVQKNNIDISFFCKNCLSNQINR